MSEKEESAGVSPREAVAMGIFGAACDRAVGVRTRDGFVELGVRLPDRGEPLLFVGMSPANALVLARSLRNAATACLDRSLPNSKIHAVPRTGARVDARPSPEEEAAEAIGALIVAANACPTIDDPRILLEHRPRVFSGDLAAALERVNALRGPTTPPAVST